MTPIFALLAGAHQRHPARRFFSPVAGAYLSTLEGSLRKTAG